MTPNIKQRYLQHIDRLISEGQSATRMTFKDEWGNGHVDLEAFSKWRTSCNNLVHQIGASANSWSEGFPMNTPNRCVDASVMFGRLRALKEAVEHDLLTRVVDIVSADAFGSLLEQADELLSKGYVVAAGVLGRAVMEEHLRKLCNHHRCLPVTNRPTINDLNQSLYKVGQIDKLGMQTVTAMATIGNDCAHNTIQHMPQDVRKFLNDVRDFMVRHPLS